MSKYRKEVSDVRIRMINKQHNHALLLQVNTNNFQKNKKKHLKMF